MCLAMHFISEGVMLRDTYRPRVISIIPPKLDLAAWHSRSNNWNWCWTDSTVDVGVISSFDWLAILDLANWSINYRYREAVIKISSSTTDLTESAHVWPKVGILPSYVLSSIFIFMTMP